MNPERFRHDIVVQPASRFHERDLLADPAPRVVECRPTGRALVLGSLQRFLVVDDAAVRRHGLEVTRRRSGGGAVLVVPDELVWFDVIVPADHPSFVAAAGDVTASMMWLGHYVLAALRSLGVADVEMHEGPMHCPGWCRLICFAGIAAGEVTLGGHKLVGISQRRTRSGARFQCAVHTTWSPQVLVELLAAPKPALAELPEVATLEPAPASALPDTLARVLGG